MAKKKTAEIESAGVVIIPSIESMAELRKSQGQTAEQFLTSKGIDPPIKSAPIQNLTFDQLCELMTEFKNA